MVEATGQVKNGHYLRDWWQALLATSPWQAVEPHSQLRAGMLIELAPR